MIAAIVVGFFPDLPTLDNLLLRLLQQVDLLVFVDNGAGENFLRDHPAERAQVSYQDLGGNKGLGYALNVGFELAIKHGCDYVATFDQDSNPPESMLAGLLAVHQKLDAQGVNCAAVGPVFFDYREGKKVSFPFYKEINRHICVVPEAQTQADVVEVDVLITSGMLIKSAVWAAGVKYDAGLFVDYTDTDWCFRARAAGYSLYASFEQEMGHALSEAPPLRLLGLNFFTYSPLRRYYYFRNTVLFVRQSYVSTTWRRRLVTGILVRFLVSLISDEKKIASLRMMSRGIKDGIKRNDGAFH